MTVAAPSPARLTPLVTVDLRGLDRLVYILSRSTRNALDALAKGLYDEGLIIFHASQRQTPIRYGFLRASGYATPPTIISTTAAVMTLGYGGVAAPYAWWVHERRINHRTGLPIRHDPPTKSHFLSDPVNEAARNMDARLSRRVGSSIFSGG